MNPLGPFEQDILRFSAVRIGDAALDGANLRAFLRVMKPDAFAAQIRVDHEEVFSQTDRIVRALAFTGPA